jgi:hypothetical protein
MANYLALPDALNHPLNRSQISSCVPPCSRRLGNLHACQLWSASTYSIPFTLFSAKPTLTGHSSHHSSL